MCVLVIGVAAVMSTQRREQVSHETRAGQSRFSSIYGAVNAQGSAPYVSQHVGLVCRHEGLVERYLSNGFVFHIFLYLILVVAVILIWIVIFEVTNLEEHIGSTAVQQMIGPVSLFIGLSFYTLVQFTFNSYTVPVEQFVRLGQRILTACTAFYASLECTTAVQYAQLLDECEAIFRALCYYDFRLFNCTERDRGDDVIRHTMLRPEDSAALLLELSQNRSGNYAAENLRTLIAMLKRRARLLEHRKLMSGGDYAALVTYVRDVEVSLEDVRAAQIVMLPQIFRDFIYTSIFMYMFIFVPISIRTATSNIAFLIIGYALVAFTILGFLFYKNWVGEPFDDSLRVATLDYRALLEDWMATVSKRRQHATHAEETMLCT